MNDLNLQEKVLNWSDLYSLLSERASTGAEGWAGIICEKKVTVLSRKVGTALFYGQVSDVKSIHVCHILKLITK